MNHRLVSFLIFFVLAALFFTSQVHAENKYWIKVTPTVTGKFTVDADIQTNIPGSITLYMGLSLHGLKPDDAAVGTDYIKVPVTNGKGKGTIDGTKGHYPPGSPLWGGKYDVEVSYSPFWPEHKAQASQLNIKDTIEGKASIKLVASGTAPSPKGEPKSDKPLSPQFLKFKELYLELLSFKDNPEFHEWGFSREPAKTWEKKRIELSKLNNATEIFTNEQNNFDLFVGALGSISWEYMHSNGKETDITAAYTPKLKKVFGTKANGKNTKVAASNKINAFDINAYCSKVSEITGGSYQIEETCREQENEALTKMNSMSIPEKIEKYCTNVGQAVGGSYAIMLTCIEQELEAKGRLK